ncbi:MAG: AMP-binding protein [Chloroflexi bacterium]|nr:AMP-binding protein [Chloroflexota bacterium]
MAVRRHFNRELEAMSGQDFRAFQWQALLKQIKYTYEKSGLCQRQFRQAGITPDDIKTPEDFARKVPFTTKEDLLADQVASPPYGTRLAIPLEQVRFTYVTSGTSGKGQEVHTDSARDLEYHIERGLIIYTWSGWVPGDRSMNSLPIGMTGASPTHSNALQRLGCDVFNLGIYDTKTKVDFIHRFKLTGMLCVPAYLDTLTTVAEEMGFNPARDFSVRKIITGTQAYPVSFIERMEARWNAKIYDFYGSTQGAAGTTCEKGAVHDGQRGHYHMFEHMAYIEVINYETGQPAGPGEIGGVVVTPINREASPFLRFKLGDRVRYFPPEACDCGRPFSLFEAGTVARYDDMMKIKGTNIWPETIDEIVLSKEETSEYQGRLYISADRRETAEITIEFKTTVTPEVKQELMHRLADEIRDKTGIGFVVKEATGPLPHAVFKVRRWTDERSKGLG